jgi:hypothetical protein
MSLIAGLAVGCGGHVPVQTAVAPNARLVRLRYFMILQPHVTNATSSSDPLVRNPPVLHTVSYELLLGFQGRGYLADTAAPDFAVAYYVASHLPVDTTVFTYGYPFAPYAWWHDAPAAAQPPSPDSQAIIIVDVTNPKTKELLWRGESVVRLRAGAGMFVEALKRGVDAVVNSFQPGIGTGPIAPRPLEHGGRYR